MGTKTVQDERRKDKTLGTSDYAALARDLFARHLDLAPLGSRTHGVVLCVFHRERTASLSIDLAAGLFNCFGCGAQGGVRDFAALVGEPLADSPQEPRRPRTPREEARGAVLWREQRARERRARYTDAYALADAVRGGWKTVMSVRTSATDTPNGWDLLALTADLERELWKLDDFADEALVMASVADRRRSA